MTREDNIIIPRWFLEVLENTLWIQNNINLDKKTGETCQDRNIRQSLNGVRKLLKGEELTGMERLEKLQPPLPSDIEERLTWEDIAKIDDMLREVENCVATSDLPTMGREEYYTEVLNRYNELKKK